MTKPDKTEKKESFLHRFMKDADACREYPNEADRFERGAALWDNRDALEAANALGYNSERDGAEAFGGRHLQAGVVGYPEMVHPVTKVRGISVLVEKEVIDRMRESAKGVPVINWAHDFSGGAEKWIADGKAVGVMTGSSWNGEDAWEHCHFMLWDKEAKANARNGFRLSNSWKADDIDWTPGVHNGVNYDGRLIAAHYTHLAIVPDPRYEGAVIYANSKGGFEIMKLFGFGKEAPVELAKDAAIDVEGKKYPLLEVVNAITALEAEKAKVSTNAVDGILGPKDDIEVNGKKYSGVEVANALAALTAKKTAVIEPEVKKEPAAKFEETPEFKNAVDARVTEILDKKVGEGFFNGIEALARLRPGQEAAAPARRGERERVEAGRKRFGKKDAVKA